MTTKETTAEYNRRMNLQLYELYAAPPDEAVSKIRGGRMSGKSSIAAQWRIRCLTEEFGPIGQGWKYEIVRRDLVRDLPGKLVVMFVEVALRYRCKDGEWSEPVSGTGGNQLVKQESGGHYVNDECEKMAITDALSVCCKQLGIASDVYAGLHDDKYGNDRHSGTAVQQQGRNRVEQAKNQAESKPQANVKQQEKPESASLRVVYEGKFKKAIDHDDIKGIYVTLAEVRDKMTPVDYESVRLAFIGACKRLEIDPRTALN